MTSTPEHRTGTDRREVDVTDRVDRPSAGAERVPERERAADHERTTEPIAERERTVERQRLGERPVAAPAGNGAAIAALVTGLLSATFAFLLAPALAAIVFGAVAIGTGVKGISIANSLGGLHKGLAVTGIVSGLLGLLLGVAVIVGGITLYNEIEQSDLPNQIQQLLDP